MAISNIQRKIAGIKLRYINIAMILLFLASPFFLFFCISQEKLLWNHAAYNYLRAKGYDVERIPIKEWQDIDPAIEFPTLELDRAIPYYTDREARALTYFWNEWIKWPVRITSGLMIAIFLMRWTKED